MTPESPVLPHCEEFEIVYAKNQPEYLPLPALRIGRSEDGIILTRWRMSWRERWQAFLSGSVFVQVMTFRKPLQPLMVRTEAPPAENVLP